jgi:hypothetical protein
MTFPPRRWLMASSGQDHTTSLFDWCVGACVFGAADVIVQSRPWPLLVGCLLAALVFQLLKVRWVGIQQKFPEITSRFERIALSPRFRRSVAILVVGCFVLYVMAYLHSLRRDLDRYVMPRTITAEQSDALREFLSHHEAHAVTVKVNVHDAEALTYAGQIFNALKRTDWDVTLNTADNSEGNPNTLNDGLCIETVGDNPPDPKHDPRPLLEEALKTSHIVSNCGGGGGGGEYRLFLCVGHRRLNEEEGPMFFLELARKIQQLGWFTWERW